MFRTIARRGTIAVVALSAFAMASASPAAAKIIYREESVTSDEPLSQVSVTARCPDGFKVISGGATNSMEFGMGWVNSAAPTDGPDLDIKPNDAFTAWVDNLSANEIAVSAYAVCGKGKAFRHVTYHRQVTSVPVSHHGSVRAKCPKGSKVLGGGALNPGAYGAAYVTSTRPADGSDHGKRSDDAWISRIDNFEGNPNIELTALAICAKGSVTHGLEYKSKKRTVKPRRQAYEKALCSRGDQVIGGGASAPYAFQRSGFLHTMRPVDGSDHDSRPDDGWISFYDNADTDSSMQMKTYAICHS